MSRGKYFNTNDVVNIDNTVNTVNVNLSSSRAVFDGFKNWNEIEGLIKEINDERFRKKCENTVREIRRIKRFRGNIPNSVEFINEEMYCEVRFSWGEFKFEGARIMREDIEIGVDDNGDKVWVERKVKNKGVEIGEIGRYVGFKDEKK